MNKMLGMCFNRNVVGGLVALGLALFLVAPDLALAALPFLLLAACPLSMLVMALLMGRGMRQGSRGMQGTQGPLPEAADMPRGPEDRLRELRAQLRQVQEQQTTLAQQIAELDRSTGKAQEPSLPLKEPVKGS